MGEEFMTTSQGLSRCSLDQVCPFLAPKMVPTFQLEENIFMESLLCARYSTQYLRS